MNIVLFHKFSVSFLPCTFTVLWVHAQCKEDNVFLKLLPTIIHELI